MGHWFAATEVPFFCLKCSPQTLHRDTREKRELDLRSEKGGVPVRYKLYKPGQVISFLCASVSSPDFCKLVLTCSHTLALSEGREDNVGNRLCEP